MPGLHIVWWPFETLKKITWSYPGQNGALRVLSSVSPSYISAQMDIPPMDCITKDQIRVDVDATLVYNITGIHGAVCNTGDVLNIVYQYVQQVLQEVVSQREVAELRQWKHLGDEIKAQINKQIKENDGAGLGIFCSRFLIQNITMDDALLAANEEIYKKKRQAQMLIEQQRATHEQELAKLEQDNAIKQKQLAWEKEQCMRQNELAMLQAEHASKIRLTEAKTQAEKEALYVRAMLDTGMSTEQFIRFRTATTIANSTNAKLYAPLEWFGRWYQPPVVDGEK